jgi:hypothetical protein
VVKRNNSEERLARIDERLKAIRRESSELKLRTEKLNDVVRVRFPRSTRVHFREAR